MKKTIITLLALIFSLSITLAQDLKLGIKAGLNVTNLKTDKSLFNSENNVGYVAGVWGRLGGNSFHFQPEAYFTSKNASINIPTDQAATDFVKGDLKFTNIDVPLLIGTKFPLGPIKAKLQAGPLFSFVIDEKKSYGSNISDVSKEALTNYKDKFSSLVFGTGVDIAKIAVDLRYEYGLGNISKYEGEKQKLNLWTITVGYSFF